jgi:hypothetical protein
VYRPWWRPPARSWILLLAGVVVSAFTGAVMSVVLTLVLAPQLRNAFLAAGD